MEKKRLAILTGVLNSVLVLMAIAAWLQTQDKTINVIDIAGLLALIAFSLMWVHYLSDAIREHWYPNQTVGVQYHITRWVVLGAIILHPALINLYLLQQDYGVPPNSYIDYFGASLVPFITLGWIALTAFLLFEFKRQLKKRGWWRYVLHFNIAAMFLILIHGFQLGAVTENSWYSVVWWLYIIGFWVISVRYYMRYYKTMMRRKFIAIGVVCLFIVAVVIAGFSSQPTENYNNVTEPQQTQKREQQTTTQMDSDKAITSETDTITADQLSAQNGKNGTSCWVAVNGIVYDATNSPEWVDGEHVPSRGQASCGRDLSNVIGQSPHGTSVLGELTKVGDLN